MLLRRKYKRKKYSKLNGIFTTVSPNSPYPNTYANMPLDMDDWDCDTWKQYYLNNKAILGQQAAINFIDLEVARVGYFAEVGKCFTNCDFINFMRSEGFSINTFLGDIYCDVTGTITGITKSAKTTTNYLLPIAIGGAVLIGGLIIYDKTKK